MDFKFDSHSIAEVTLIGMAFEMIGGLYLAYDLLGGKRGPLRTVTRATSYTILFFVGYALVLGLKYALIAAIGMGLTLALEFGLAENVSNEQFPRLKRFWIFGTMRGIVLGLAATTAFGRIFGLVFGLFSAVGLSSSYMIGYSPTDDYTADSRPRIRWHQVAASGLRGLAVAFAGVAAGIGTARDSHFWLLGLKLGLAAGVVSIITGTFSPVIESRIESLPERRLGLIGIGMIFLGSTLQTLQYWVVLFSSR